MYIYKKNVTCYITHALTKLRFAVQETKKNFKNNNKDYNDTPWEK